jgi:hypothetical protein
VLDSLALGLVQTLEQALEALGGGGIGHRSHGSRGSDVPSRHGPER